MKQSFGSSQASNVAFSLAMLIGLSSSIVLFGQGCSPALLPNTISLNDQGSLGGLVESEGEILYKTHCSTCHGVIQSTAKRNRTSAQITAAIRDISQMQAPLAGVLSKSQIEKIAIALENNFPVAKGNPFQCGNPSEQADTTLNRLTKDQYVNNLTDLFGTSVIQAVSSDINLLPEDTILGSVKRFNNLYDRFKVDSFYKIAKSISSVVVNNNTNLARVAPSCIVNATQAVSDACRRDFINNLGLKAYRRPLSQLEIEDYLILYSYGSSVKGSVELVLRGFLQAPNFLYHIEVGDQNTNELGQYQLTSYELASRLSFLITDSMPDAELFSLAANRTILEAEVLSKQVDRLLTTARAKTKQNRFLNYWLELESAPQLPIGPPGFVAGLQTQGLRDELIRESYEFYNHLYFDKKAKYTELMTSNLSFARTPASGSVYGHSPVTNTPATMSNDRVGIVLKAPFLLGSDFTTHPILRGAKFRRQVLCDQMPLPAPDNFNLGPDVNTLEMILSRSTRERTDLKTGTGSCVACHSYINPVGFAFESFDSFGRYRNQETQYSTTNGTVLATHAIDPSGVMPPLGGSGQTIAFASAKDLIHRVVESTSGESCFLRHKHQFFQLRAESSLDSCTLSKMYDASAHTDGSMIGSLKAIVMSPAFRRGKTKGI